MPVSSDGRIALYLQDKHPLRDGIEYVRHAEDRGFEAVWQAESRLVREATVPMAAFAATTERIKVGSGVVNSWTRNVGLLAATFVTLDDLAPGRILLGIGAWWEPLASKVGVDRRKPLQAMREVTETVRRLIAMERVTFHGEFVDVDDIMTGFWKSLCFGVIVTWVATYKGFHAGHGAEGVARATTQAVVLSSVLILLWDYFMGSVLP